MLRQGDVATTKATRKPKTKAEKATFSNKVSELMHEGATKDNKQAVAIAYSELRKGGVKRLKQSKEK